MKCLMYPYYVNGPVIWHTDNVRFMHLSTWCPWNSDENHLHITMIQTWPYRVIMTLGNSDIAFSNIGECGPCRHLGFSYPTMTHVIVLSNPPPCGSHFRWKWSINPKYHDTIHNNIGREKFIYLLSIPSYPLFMVPNM